MEFSLIVAAVVWMLKLACGSVTVRSHVEVFLGDKALLECVYSGQEKWYLMQWKKKKAGSDQFETIVTVTSTMFEPEYSRKFEDDFYRMRADIRHDNDDDSRVAFDLAIYNVQCTDEATYKCVITAHNAYSGQTALSIIAAPKRPHISYEILSLSVNQSYTLRCEGNVGNPAGLLHWFVQRPSEDVFSWVHEQDTSVSEKKDCSFTSVTTLTITVTEKADGNIYRCAVESPHVGQITSTYFDEVTVRLPEKPQKQCDGAMCDAANFAMNITDRDWDDSNSSAKCFGSLHMPAMLYFLLCILLWR